MDMDIEIADFVPPVKENPFSPLIDRLIEAGEGKQATLKNIAVDDVPKTRKKIRAAANLAERTAKIHDVIDNGDGTASIVVTLTARQYRPNAGKPAEGEAVEAEAEAKPKGKK